MRTADLRGNGNTVRIRLKRGVVVGMEAFVTKLGTLPTTWPPQGVSRQRELSALRATLSTTQMPPQIATIVVRFASRALSAEEPPNGAAWSSVDAWDEDSLHELCALLVDALSGDYEGAVAACTAVRSLSTAPHDHLQQENKFSKLMRTPEDHVVLADTDGTEMLYDNVERLGFTILMHNPPLAHALPAIQKAFESSMPAHLAAAHVVHFLLSLARHERAAPLRRGALLALAALSRAMPPDLLSSFLPGIISGLVRLLTRCRVDQAFVVVAALDALSAAVLTAFVSEAQLFEYEKNGSAFSFANALENISDAEGTCNEVPYSTAGQDALASGSSDVKSFMHPRDEPWFTKSSHEVSERFKLFLESQDGASRHASVRVRLGMARFASIMLFWSSALRLESHALSLLRLILLDYCGDPYPVVENVAIGEVLKLKSARRLPLGDVEYDFKVAATVAIEFARKHEGHREQNAREESEEGTSIIPASAGNSRLQGATARDLSKIVTAILRQREEEDLLRLCKGYLRVFFPSEGRHGWWRLDTHNESSRLASFLTRIGVENICQMLLLMLQQTWTVATGRSELFQVELENPVLGMAYRIGQIGLEALVYPFLFSSSSLNNVGVVPDDLGSTSPKMESPMLSFSSRSYAALLLQAVVRGAILREAKDDDMMRQTRQVLLSSKELLLQLNHFALPTEECGAGEWSGVIDDNLISLKRCLLHCTGLVVGDLAKAHQLSLCSPMPSDVVLTALVSLLVDASGHDESVRQTAHQTLQTIAKVTSCYDERRLIFRHLNFLMSRVIQNLDTQWAGNVLGLIVGEQADEISQEAIALLEGSIREICNNLAAATDSRALKSLAVTRKVLQTAVKQSRALRRGAHAAAPLEREGSNNVRLITKEDKDRIHRKLMYYCTDGVSDCATSTGSNKGDHRNEHLGRADDEENAPTSFEILANDTLVGMQDLLVGRVWEVRAAALACAVEAIHLLRDNEKVLLPHAAKLLPLLPEQFKLLEQNMSAAERMLYRSKQRKAMGREDGEEVEDLVRYVNGKGAELPVVRNACILLSALAPGAGTFIKERFVNLVFPRMRPLLRLASCFPSLATPPKSGSNGQPVAPPSYGAMSAADACLEALAALAESVPTTLTPYSAVLLKHTVVYVASGKCWERQQRDTTSNQVMLRYERERLKRRTEWAEVILRSQVRVNPGTVVVELLRHDVGIGKEVSSPCEALQNLSVKKC